MSASNRRSHRRLEGRGLAGHIRSAAGDPMPGMLIENISMGGLFLRTARELPIGTPLSIELVRRGLKRAIVLSGKVVSHTSALQAAARGSAPGLGVRFDPGPAALEARLQELMTALGGGTPEAPAPAVPASTRPEERVIEPIELENEDWRQPIAMATTQPEHVGAGRVLQVAPGVLDAKVRELSSEVERLRDALAKSEQVVASMRATFMTISAELMRKEQEISDLRERLERGDGA